MSISLFDFDTQSSVTHLKLIRLDRRQHEALVWCEHRLTPWRGWFQQRPHAPCGAHSPARKYIKLKFPPSWEMHVMRLRRLLSVFRATTESHRWWWCCLGFIKELLPECFPELCVERLFVHDLSDESFSLSHTRISVCLREKNRPKAKESTKTDKDLSNEKLSRTWGAGL